MPVDAVHLQFPILHCRRLLFGSFWFNSHFASVWGQAKAWERSSWDQEVQSTVAGRLSWKILLMDLGWLNPVNHVMLADIYPINRVGGFCPSKHDCNSSNSMQQYISIHEEIVDHWLPLCELIGALPIHKEEQFETISMFRTTSEHPFESCSETLIAVAKHIWAHFSDQTPSELPQKLFSRESSLLMLVSFGFRNKSLR